VQHYTCKLVGWAELKRPQPFLSTSFTIHQQQQFCHENAGIINYTKVHRVTDEMEQARYLGPELHTEEMFVALLGIHEQQQPNH
jgi:hypothetical protein